MSRARVNFQNRFFGHIFDDIPENDAKRLRAIRPERFRPQNPSSFHSRNSGCAAQRQPSFRRLTGENKIFRLFCRAANSEGNFSATPRRVKRSKMPSSRSRRRSSKKISKSLSPAFSKIKRAVALRPPKGELKPTFGFSVSSRNHFPSLIDCSSPNSESGTSCSRSGKSIVKRFSVSAFCRARFDVLCPCRTSQSDFGFWILDFRFSFTYFTF